MIRTHHMPHFETSDILKTARRLVSGQSGALGVFFCGPGVPDLAATGALLAGEVEHVFGGVVPAVIHAGRVETVGTLFAFFEGADRPRFVASIDELDMAASNGLFEQPMGRQSALVLVAGHAVKIGGFLSGLYRQNGHGVCYLGGGLGTLDDPDAPALFVGDQTSNRGAVVVPQSARWTVGARHGWNVLHEPLLASRTTDNVIHELNWEPALDVYRKLVEPDAGAAITPKGFFDVAKGYPFGMHREGAEPVVRDPISVSDDGSLVCVAEVPQNVTLSLLRGEPDTLIEAAGQAAADAVTAASAQRPPSPRGAFVFDCVSRAIYLGDDYSREIDAFTGQVQAAGCHAPSGLLTLGEVANHRAGNLEFFNKTIVVGVYHG